MDDELMDLVSRDDKVIGTINRKDYDRLLTEDLGYIRAADVFLVNSDGRVFVPTRTTEKTIAPGGYDFSAGGHVGSGENYLKAIVRETQEELNIDIDIDYLLLVDKTILDDIKYIRHLYLYRTEETPVFNRRDFTTAEWMTPADLVKNIDNGHPAKSNLKASVSLLNEFLSAT
jgi:isopentenyl-diphosphate delta-isomerase